VKDLSQLLTALPFPTALDRVRRSFARQPDCQTCGAAAIRHGLLLGGLTIPTAALEAVLSIRENQGTAPATLRACLVRLGLEVRLVRKPGRRRTADFLDSLRPAFEQGAFLVPCILGAAHWVCIGAWQFGRVALVDSFFDGSGGAAPHLSPRLGFFNLSADEFDALDWEHHVMLVRPGVWQAQYLTWHPARPALLRMNARQPGGRGVTLVQAIRQGAHQHLDDAESIYKRLELRLARDASVAIEADDPGGNAVGVESLGSGANEVVVVRRLGGLLDGRPGVAEVVLRAAALRAGQLAG
jgi:hypothetical protein